MMNKSELTIMTPRTRARSVSLVSSSRLRPVMYVTYEGTNGSTQGETNESNPAANAMKREMSGA